MRIDTYPQVAVIRSEVAEDFEDSFNRKMQELSNKKILSQEITVTGDTITAVITYEESAQAMDCVADEFHAEGIIFLCKHCPHLVDPKDKRVKHCECKYAEFGHTHKDHEACEVFYRELKLHKIQPIPDTYR